MKAIPNRPFLTALINLQILVLSKSYPVQSSTIIKRTQRASLNCSWKLQQNNYIVLHTALWGSHGRKAGLRNSVFQTFFFLRIQVYYTKSCIKRYFVHKIQKCPSEKCQNYTKSKMLKPQVNQSKSQRQYITKHAIFGNKMKRLQQYWGNKLLNWWQINRRHSSTMTDAYWYRYSSTMILMPISIFTSTCLILWRCLGRPKYYILQYLVPSHGHILLEELVIKFHQEAKGAFLCKN